MAMNTRLENGITYRARSGGSKRLYPDLGGKIVGYVQNPVKACPSAGFAVFGRRSTTTGPIRETQSLLPPSGHLTKNKKATIASGLRKSLILMVPEAGIEPARRERRGILNQRASFASYCMK